MPNNLNQIIIILSHLRFNPVIWGIYYDSISPRFVGILQADKKLFLGLALFRTSAYCEMIASVLAIFWIFSLFARYREEEILGMSKSRHKKLQYFAQLCCGGLTSNFNILSKKNVAGVTVETLCNILKGNMQIAFLILGKFCSSVIC